MRNLVEHNSCVLFLLFLSTFLTSASARRALPTIGGNVTTQVGLQCAAEGDCPIRQYCYIDKETDIGTCDCYQFYGFYGPECLGTSPIAPIFTIVSLTFCLYQMAMWIITFKQITDKKVNAFKAGSASGHVTIACMIANILEIGMHLCYMLVAIGANPTYEVNDLARPLIFGLCMIVKLTGGFEIPIMWMDIVIKSPGMNSPENKAKFKKIATILRVCATLSGTIVIFCILTGNATAAAFFFMFVLVCSIAMYIRASRLLALMICKNFWKLGYSPGEDKFANSAESSGHRAAKNILAVGNSFAKAAAMFFFSLATLGVTAQIKSGLTPFIAANAFLISMSLIQGIFRGYVRLGARKKLAAAGFESGSKVSAATVTSSAVSSSD